ncbi:hypothetical protein [Actinokineospora sp.]|uniref:hypothetical protein n=1 Tax=Actinokineospora sp. TaxID=1872133 RepID=UPI004037BEC1
MSGSAGRKAVGYLARDLVTSPNSFAKPKAVLTAKPPGLGEAAPTLPILDGGPAVVAFLRHIGCPFAEATLRHLAGLSATEGIHNRRANGSRWQSAGTFAVTDGTIRWRHLPAHAGDLPPLDEAVAAALRGRAE